MKITLILLQIGVARHTPIEFDGEIRNQSFRREDFKIVNRIGFNPKEDTKLTGHNKVRFTIQIPLSNYAAVCKEIFNKTKRLEDFTVDFDQLQIPNCYIEDEYVEGNYRCLNIYSKRTSHY